MKKLLEFLEQADLELFLFLNGLNSEFLDPIMVIISGKFTLIPLYLLFTWLVYRKVGIARTGLFLLFTGLCIFLADQGAVKLFKEVFERYRPCHNLDFGESVHTAGHCGGKYGFISNHAANTMAAASFIFLSTRAFYRHLWILLATWVLLVGYSRIYLGVHYPLDILGGWLFGLAIGSAVWLLYKKLVLK